MGVQDVQYEVLGLVSVLSFAVAEALTEGVGDVDGHGRHPEEEGNPCVLDDEAKCFTEGNRPSWVMEVIRINSGVKSIADSGKKEGQEDVEEEANSELSKQF